MKFISLGKEMTSSLFMTNLESGTVVMSHTGPTVYFHNHVAIISQVFILSVEDLEELADYIAKNLCISKIIVFDTTKNIDVFIYKLHKINFFEKINRKIRMIIDLKNYKDLNGYNKRFIKRYNIRLYNYDNRTLSYYRTRFVNRKTEILTLCCEFLHKDKDSELSEQKIQYVIDRRKNYKI